ncbi:MAG: hypothetical protein KF862_00170 [Chitinophagaceae bacterium]|nr:hypothetical protein [Chitinophagaceae bacterium]
MIMWFMLVPLIAGSLKKTDNIVSGFQFNLKNFFVFFLISAVVITVFAIVLYCLVIQKAVIKDGYFLDDFNARITVYSFFGYVLSALCFGSYLYQANALELLNKDPEGEDVTKNKKLLDAYLRIRSSFNFSFYSTAVILSVFVLWTAVLSRSINGLEAFRFYSLLSGKTFPDPNFVYLFGAIHSLLLLIFYVPVRIQFNGLKLTQQQKEDEKAGLSDVKKGIKATGEMLGTILITASPLITSILEKMLSGF